MNLKKKFGVNTIFILTKKKKTFIQQGCIELIKNDTKAIYNVIEDFYTNKHFVLNVLFKEF